MATYSRDQLIPLIRKYFGTGQEDKWLHLINGESGFRDDAVGDGGAAYGLFQSQHNPGQTLESQFADAKRLYDADKANGGTGFGDWGEGRLYQGKPFGALGNSPYPGGTGMTQPSSGFDAAGSLQKQIADIEAIFAKEPKHATPDWNHQDEASGLVWDSANQQWVSSLTPDEAYDTWAEQAVKARQVLPQYYSALNSITKGLDSTAQGQLAVSQQNADTNSTNTAVSIAQQAINRNLSGLAESGRRSDLIQKGTQDLMKYGLPNGQTDWSDAELGGSFASVGKLLGRDPNAKYKLALGTVNVDPEGDLARYDSQFGVTGALPDAYGNGDSGYRPGPTMPPVNLADAVAGLGTSSGSSMPPLPAYDPGPVDSGANVDPSTGMPRLPGGAGTATLTMPANPQLGGPQYGAGITPPPWSPPDYASIFRRLSQRGF